MISAASFSFLSFLVAAAAGGIGRSVSIGLPVLDLAWAGGIGRSVSIGLPVLDLVWAGGIGRKDSMGVFVCMSDLAAAPVFESEGRDDEIFLLFRSEV